MRTVVRHIRELLGQLVGARSLAVYFVDEDGAPARCPSPREGVDVATLPTLALGKGRRAIDEPLDPVSAVIERAFLTGVPHVAEGDVACPSRRVHPAALEDSDVGAIVVYTCSPRRGAS